MKITRGKIKSAQKVVIYGVEGIGKSTMASHFPEPLFIDTEGSTKHLDVARTPVPSSWTMLISQIDYVKNNPDICQSLIIDTADWIEKLAVEDLLASYKKNSMGGFPHGQGYVHLEAKFGRFLNRLTDIVNIGINVVLVAHAQITKFELPDESGSYNRWEMKLEKKTRALMKEWADMILFANYKTFVVKDEKTGSNKAQGGKRVMYATHHPAWDAKNRHNLPEELPLEFASIAHCIPTRISSTPVIAEPDPKIEQEPTKPNVSNLIEKIKIEQETQSEPLTPQQEKKEEEPLEDLLNGPSAKINSISKPLYDLMYANFVTDEEIQEVVAAKGYYPKNTPIRNFDPSFISGVLVGAWPQVFAMIKEVREKNIPF